MRAGTENLASIVGMAKALELAYEDLETNQSHILGLKNYLKEKLTTNFTDISFNGDVSDNSLYTVLNVAFPSSIDGDMFIFNLDIKGICCSAGSACSSGANTGSHVIQALGKKDDKTSIRFSFSHENTKEELDQLVQILRMN